MSWDGNAFTLTFSDGFKVTCDKLINAAGLHAGQLAETFVEPRLLPKLLVQNVQRSIVTFSGPITGRRELVATKPYIVQVAVATSNTGWDIFGL